MGVNDEDCPTGRHPYPRYDFGPAAATLNPSGVVELILPAGNFVCLDLLKPLQAVAETVAVYGNGDRPEVVRHLPSKQYLLNNPG